MAINQLLNNINNNDDSSNNNSNNTNNTNSNNTYNNVNATASNNAYDDVGNIENNNIINNDEPKIVQTDEGSKDGQNKCPKCGSTDISVNAKTGRLRCNFCRHQFEPVKIQGMETDLLNLQGEIIGSGAQDIEKNGNKADAETNSKDVITLKCTSCGAEVVINTAESTQARCHWCRNTLSINKQIPNGVVPDVVLPFHLTKEEAKQQIQTFVGKRKFFAHPKFVQEFTTENIMGVYFPYMVVDINSHAKFSGHGEHEVRHYTRRNGDTERTYYDADLYQVVRDFDLTIEGLTVESSSDKLEKSSNKTNNIINSIMPFDMENAVKYDSNYLKGYSSEKRDTNIDELRPLVETQSKDIARFAANDTIKQYDRGVKWQDEDLDVKGRQWKTAYLPVWLYSYQEKKGENNSLLHYIAVNARTKETMGSIPIHMPKLFGASAIVEFIGFLLFLWADDFNYRFLFLLIGFIYFFIIYTRYRNSNARHHHETETNKKMYNLRKYDQFVKHKTGLSNSRMEGANNTRLGNESVSDKIVGTFNKLK